MTWFKNESNLLCCFGNKKEIRKQNEKESFNMIVQIDKMCIWLMRQQPNIHNCPADHFHFECHNGHHMSRKKDDVHKGAKAVSWEQKKWNVSMIVTQLKFGTV